jgi:hypothetical protein
LQSGSGSAAKENLPQKLKTFFAKDSQVMWQVPVLVGPAKYFEPGTRRGGPPALWWLLPPAQIGNEKIPSNSRMPQWAEELAGSAKERNESL